MTGWALLCACCWRFRSGYGAAAVRSESTRLKAKRVLRLEEKCFSS